MTYQKILIRVPEKFAKDICKNQDHWLEKESDDKVVTVYIGRRRTAKNQQLPNYHCIPSNGHYDFIEAGSDNTDCLKLRVLKFPVGDLCCFSCREGAAIRIRQYV